MLVLIWAIILGLVAGSIFILACNDEIVFLRYIMKELVIFSLSLSVLTAGIILMIPWYSFTEGGAAIMSGVGVAAFSGFLGSAGFVFLQLIEKRTILKRLEDLQKEKENNPNLSIEGHPLMVDYQKMKDEKKKNWSDYFQNLLQLSPNAGVSTANA